jgi:GT2 family glycosyltransferase
MTQVSIAVIITCFDRYRKTLSCLDHLFKQEGLNECGLSVYLLDDASMDRTIEAVQSQYTNVILLHGNGHLFWNRGMHNAWQKAFESNYNYYLWINDDTMLVPQALSCLLSTHHKLSQLGHSESIIVGSTQDPDTRDFTYGGIIRTKFWHPLKFTPIAPSQEPIQCATMNGNCVLIPRAVAQKVGNLDPVFTHSMGDFDYGLRARQHGCSVWVAPGYLGTCSLNSNQNTWQDINVPLGARLQKVKQPKGLPTQEWRLFARRHAGPFWYIYWVSPYIRLLLTSMFTWRNSE